MKKLIGIIPAAGFGTRLYPYNGGKELLPVGTESVLMQGKIIERPKIVSQYIIDSMVEAGVKNIIIITNPAKHKLMEFHLNGGKSGANIVYIVQNSISMAHSINLAYEWIKDSTVIMGMPDTIALPQNCFKQLIKKHNSADLSLGLFLTDKPYKFGMIKTDNAFNITYHRDKPSKTKALMMWGIAIWEPCFTKILHKHIKRTPPVSKEITLGDIFDIALDEGRSCKAYPIVGGKYYDIGTYDDYKRAILDL
jgi:glucose-1-phosphate thymidylyltransferase